MTLYTGLTYQATPRLALTGAYYYSDAKNINGFERQPWHAAVLLAECQAQVYGTVDFNRTSGGANAEMPGNNQTGLGVGLRHIFGRAAPATSGSP